MFFSLLHLIGYFISSILKIFYYFVILILKLIYHLIILSYKVIRFIFIHENLRTPLIFFSFGTILSLKLYIIATIYFIYLTHKAAKKRAIYITIKNNLILYFNDIKEKNFIKSTLKNIKCNNRILSNIFLEVDDSFYYIYHLVITEKGVYNIVPISASEELIYTEAKRTLSKKSKIVNKLFDELLNTEIILSDILPDNLPLTNIVTSPYSSFMLSDTNSSINLMPTNDICSFIDSNTSKNCFISVEEITSLVLESKMWLFDKILFNTMTFFKKNKKVISFFILSPIIYFFYIITIILFSRAVIIFTTHSIEAFSNFIKF